MLYSHKPKLTLLVMSAPLLNLLNNPKIRRILVIKWGTLGELTTASAIFEDLYRAFPDARIDLNTLPGWQVLFLHDPRFKQIIATEVRKKHRKWNSMFHWLNTIARNKYDLVVDLQSNKYSRLLLRIVCLLGFGIKYRIGMNAHYPYNIRPQPSTTLKTFHCYQAALRAAGIPTIQEQPVLYYGSGSRRNFQRIQTEYLLQERDYALFFPGSSAEGYLKRWGVDNYATLAQMLHGNGMPKIVLVGTRDDVVEAEQIKNRCGDWVINLCGHTQLLDIIPLAENARFIVSNDISAARIAGVSKTPIVIISGPTKPEQNGAANHNVVSLQANKSVLNCVPCFRSQCKNPDYLRCMTLVTPEQVFISLQSMVD